jgi:hypothetical protein
LGPYRRQADPQETKEIKSEQFLATSLFVPTKPLKSEQLPRVFFTSFFSHAQDTEGRKKKEKLGILKYTGKNRTSKISQHKAKLPQV